MIARLARIALVTGSGLILSGCLLIHTMKQELLYSPEYVAYIGQEGTLPLQISGNPLGSSAETDQRLADAIDLPQWIYPRKLVPVTDDDLGKGARLVLVFNPVSLITNGDSICADPVTETRKPGPEQGMKVFAALCSADDNITRATVEDKTGAGLDDPRFRNLLDNLIRATLPARNEDHDTTDCQSFPCD